MRIGLPPRSFLPLLGRRPLLPALLVLLAAAIFLADTITNLEIAVAVFYVAIVLIAVRYLDQRGVAMVAAACMALTVLSFFLTRAGSVPASLSAESRLACMVMLLRSSAVRKEVPGGPSPRG